ncbi:MAG: DUF2807 domain-containing protein [Defluviitaleaceae bacterium]|nr:DUF2807 domain-containing protein [Defluviitaleaceae bacterium]
MFNRKIIGSGNIVERKYLLSDAIEKLDVDVPGTYNISAVPSHEITYTIDDNLLDFIEITMKNGVLGVKKTKRNEWKDISIIFNIGTDKLRDIRAANMSKVFCDGLYTAEMFKIDV